MRLDLLSGWMHLRKSSIEAHGASAIDERAVSMDIAPPFGVIQAFAAQGEPIHKIIATLQMPAEDLFEVDALVVPFIENFAASISASVQRGSELVEGLGRRVQRVPIGGSIEADDGVLHLQYVRETDRRHALVATRSSVVGESAMAQPNA